MKKTTFSFIGAFSRFIAGAMLIVVLFGAPSCVFSQPVFAEAEINPFGMGAIDVQNSGIGVAECADLDGDGDYDILYKDINFFYYYENTGTASSPTYGEAVLNPFGLEGGAFFTHHQYITIQDVDGDGDADVVTADFELTGAGGIPGNAQHTGNALYFENIGSSTLPSFSLPVRNPFGIESAEHLLMGDFVDLDGDGDLDFFTTENEHEANPTVHQFGYQENIGSSTNPNYGPKSINPFGLDLVIQDLYAENTTLQVEFGDLDVDGDQDILIGRNTSEYFYLENTGSASSPMFMSAVVDPFGLSDMTILVPDPNLVDLDNDNDLDLFVGHGLPVFDFELLYFENVSEPSGTTNESLLEHGVEIYPLENKLFIEHSEKIEEIILFDATGRRLANFAKPSARSIDIQFLVPGIYHVQVQLINQANTSSLSFVKI